MCRLPLLSRTLGSPDGASLTLKPVRSRGMLTTLASFATSPLQTTNFQNVSPSGLLQNRQHYQCTHEPHCNRLKREYNLMFKNLAHWIEVEFTNPAGTLHFLRQLLRSGLTLSVCAGGHTVTSDRRFCLTGKSKKSRNLRICPPLICKVQRKSKPIANDCY